MNAKDLADFHRLNKKRAQLQSQLNATNSQLEPLRDRIIGWLTKNKRTDAKRGAFAAMLETVKGRLSYKAELEKRISKKAFAALTPPDRQRLIVSPTNPPKPKK